MVIFQIAVKCTLWILENSSKKRPDFGVYIYNEQESCCSTLTNLMAIVTNLMAFPICFSPLGSGPIYLALVAWSGSFVLRNKCILRNWLLHRRSMFIHSTVEELSGLPVMWGLSVLIRKS